jgi:hypothetical protein
MALLIPPDPSDVPLVTVALYPEAEVMRSDLGRFDLSGIAVYSRAVADRTVDLANVLDRFPKGSRSTARP